MAREELKLRYYKDIDILPENCDFCSHNAGF